LGLLTLLVTGIGGYIAYKYLVPESSKRSNAIGAGIATSAENAAATPAAVAAVNPSWAPYASVATVHVGASVVITAILRPLLVDFLYRLEQRKSKR